MGRPALTRLGDVQASKFELDRLAGGARVEQNLDVHLYTEKSEHPVTIYEIVTASGSHILCSWKTSVETSE